MGADMMYATLPAFKVTPERCQILADVIDRQVTVPEWIADCHEVDLDEYKQQAKDHVAMLAELDDLRDVARIPRPPISLWITGGLSWGDDPTESFGTLQYLNQCDDIWHACEHFANEDLAGVPRPQPDVDLEYGWRCGECAVVVTWTMNNVAEAGQPICPRCGEDMELVEPDEQFSAH